MKISYNWLKEFIPIEISVQEFCKRITMFGVEVEAVTHLGDEFENIVIGKVLSATPHPNSDHLSVCQVDVGEDEYLSIICGAPNVQENQTVPVAKIGAVLGDFKIKKAKLRGIESFGMICSEKELGISEDYSGIMVFDENFKPGTPLATALDIDDYIIDVEVTPNRPDLLGMVGIAREVAVVLNQNYSSPKIKFNESVQPTVESISVQIENPELCPRYCCRIIKNVPTNIGIKPSPDWMQRRLRAVGLRPINNIVDVTNYVLMEYGQPLHAFDYDKISDKKIIVRRAKDGEKIKLLDEQSYTLTSQNLVIADTKKPLALAGIMGGKESSISPETKNIALECAYFNPQNIRATSLLLNLTSESSYRFERGMDPNGLEEVINRAAQLIQLTGGGEICKNIVDVYPQKIPKKKVYLRIERVNKILGTELKPDQIKSYLQRLELSVSEKNGDFEILIPTFRPDLEREIDIIEEIARCYGYQNIASKFTIPRIENRRQRIILRKIRTHLVNLGFFEACNLSFASPDVFDKFAFSENDYRRNAVVLANPQGEQFSIMRTTLIPDILGNVALNLSHKFENFKLFELNKVYLNSENGHSCYEPFFLTGVVVGSFMPRYWNSKSSKSSFFDVKGVVESLLTVLHCGQSLGFKNSDEPFYLAGQNADIFVAGEKIGSLGVVKKDILTNFDIEAHTLLFDIDITKLISYIPQKVVTYSRVIKFPPVLRDIALIAPQKISVANIKNTIFSINPEVIKDVTLFDVYQGKQIKENYRSLAFSITFQSDKMTLTDKYVDKLFDNIIKKLFIKYKIKLR